MADARTKAGRPNIQKLAQEVTRILKASDAAPKGGYRTVVRKVRELVERSYPSFRGKPTYYEIKQQVLDHFMKRSGTSSAGAATAAAPAAASSAASSSGVIPGSGSQSGTVIPAGGTPTLTPPTSRPRGKPFSIETAVGEVLNRLRKTMPEDKLPGKPELRRAVGYARGLNLKKADAIDTVVKDYS